MSAGGILAVSGVECSKLAAQIKVWITLVACAVGPFVFATAMRVQSSMPTDTLFGRAAGESGFAAALVVLGFAAFWALPVLASVVGGDLFAAEDRYGTWTTVLTRSRSRAELFAGKALTALGFSTFAVVLLAASSVASGVLIVGSAPIVDLTGRLLPPAQAVIGVSLAWASVVLPSLGFTALAIALSVGTRSTAAGIGLPVLAALAMQGYSLVDGPELFRRLLITSAFGAWHGLFAEPRYYGPLLHGTLVSGAYVIVCLALAYWMLLRRDIGR